MRTMINRRRTSRSGRLLRAAGTAALLPLGAGTAVTLDPARWALSTTPVVLHAVSFRGPLGLATTATGVASLLSARFSRTGLPWRRLTSGLVLLAGGIGQAAVVLRRGWAGRASQDRADLTVVCLNTLGGAAKARQIASLVAREMASANGVMVSLPETSIGLAEQTAELLAALGHSFQVFATKEIPGPFGTTSMLVSTDLGRYRQVPAPQLLLGAVMAKPVDGDGPTFAAVHPGAPVSGVGYPRWRHDVSTAVGIARDEPNSVVAGDFNATIDHQVMRDLDPVFDAAVRAGRGAEGTWPARFPAPLAAPIDHVLVNGPYSVLGTRTLRVGGSDHRAVVARLAATGPVTQSREALRLRKH